MSGNGPMHLSLEFYEDGSRARIELVACCDRPHTLANTPALRSITFQISGASYRVDHIDPPLAVLADTAVRFAVHAGSTRWICPIERLV